MGFFELGGRWRGFELSLGKSGGFLSYRERWIYFFPELRERWRVFDLSLRKGGDGFLG